MACSLDANVLSLFSIHSLHSSLRSTWRSWHIVSNRFKCLWAGHFLHKQKHKDLNGLTDSPSDPSGSFFKQVQTGGTPQIHWYCMLHSWTDPSGDSCPIFHQPILGDIAVMSLQHSNLGEKKVWLQRLDKSDPMMWNCVMEIPGHRCWTSHGFTCAVRSKDLTSNAWNSCPSMSVEFRELKLAGRFGALGAKKCVDMVWFHPIHLHGEPGLFSQGLEEPEDGAESDPNSDWGRCLNLMRWHVWFTLRFRCPA